MVKFKSLYVYKKHTLFLAPPLANFVPHSVPNKMASKIKFILLVFVSAGLGFCWYPLVKLESMKIEISQLLFFAFAAASLLVVFFLVCQVERWRKRTLELLIFSLVGGISNALLHYSLLLGEPIGIMSVFCMSLVMALFLGRLSSGKNLATNEFLIILLILLVAVSLLLVAKDGFVLHWSQLLAVLAGVGFYNLSMLKGQSSDGIPIMSKVGGLLIGSTWLVGMVLIFSPRSASFPHENAALFSLLYGAVLLVPMVVSLVYMLANYSLPTLLLWVTMLLTINSMGVVFYSGSSSVEVLLWPFLMLTLTFSLLFTLFKASSKIGVHSG